MAYPEPIPVLKGKEAEEFDSRLKKFRLNGAQKEFYREARLLFKAEKQSSWSTEGDLITQLFAHPAACDPARLRFEPFRTDTGKVTAFDCGDQSLNDFLCTEEVANYEKEWLGKTTLAYCEGSLAGYYTICYGQLRKEYLQTWKSFTKLGEYHVDSVPAMVVGRLAVDKKWQNKGIGRTTMQRIAMLALDNSAHSGLRLLLVQAKEDAFGFYEKLGFEYATEVKEEMKRYKARGTRTMFFDLSALDYLKTR